jgi:hypothetical protein
VLTDTFIVEIRKENGELRHDANAAHDFDKYIGWKMDESEAKRLKMVPCETELHESY